MPAEALNAPCASTAGHTDPVCRRVQPMMTPISIDPTIIIARPSGFGSPKL